MSVPTAFWVLTWAAIVVLYFGLAAVLRELRLLRGAVLRGAVLRGAVLRGAARCCADGFTTGAAQVRLGGRSGTC
jgi:hypothetical protein